MLKKYKILTITHRETTLKDLGKYVIEHDEPNELRAKLTTLRNNFGWSELLYLATCNRIMYFFISDAPVDKEAFFQYINPSFEEEDIDFVNYYEGKNALQHLYEVGASIDSLVVGEREILRQLREAYQQCHKWELTGDNIRLAMKTTIETSKEVYANTRIGEKPVSIVSLAIQKLLNYQLDKEARILMIGAGQTNNLVTKFLIKHHFNNVTIFNRSLPRAQQLAQSINGKALPLAELRGYRQGFDCIIICTAATQALIDEDFYRELLADETDEKLIIDLSIPNNIDRSIEDLFPVNYIEIDDLRQLAKANLAFRQKEVAAGLKIIHANLLTFEELYQERLIERAMRNVPNQIKEIKAHAINNVFKKDLEGLDEETFALLDRMLSYMEKRCISIPMQAAKQTINRVK